MVKIKEEICPRIDGKCPHETTTDKNKCFIVMAYEQLYSDKIETMLSNAAEKVFESEPILAKNIKHKSSMDLYCTKVCRPIKQSTICLVDVTYNSINVGLEYSVAQNFKKPVIVTKYLPQKIPKISEEERESLEKIKGRGSIQYLDLPYHPPDFASLYRVDYKNEKELIKKLENEFKVSSK